MYVVVHAHRYGGVLMYGDRFKHINNVARILLQETGLGLKVRTAVCVCVCACVSVVSRARRILRGPAARAGKNTFEKIPPSP